MTDLRAGGLPFSSLGALPSLSLEELEATRNQSNTQEHGMRTTLWNALDILLHHHVKEHLCGGKKFKRKNCHLGQPIICIKMRKDLVPIVLTSPTPASFHWLFHGYKDEGLDFTANLHAHDQCNPRGEWVQLLSQKPKISLHFT